MQSYRLRRRLRSHYSLLIPFPPLPFAFPPLSPASPVAEPLQSPALPSRGSRSTSSQTVRPGEHPFPPAPFPLREDGGEEDAPLEPDLEGDQPATGLQPRSSKSTSVAGRTAVRPVAFGPEEAFLVDFSRTYDPLNHQVRQSPSALLEKGSSELMKACLLPLLTCSAGPRATASRRPRYCASSSCSPAPPRP